MYDVITIGSATRDVFIRSQALEIHEDAHAKGVLEGCFPLGAKIEINDLINETGGGATNAAVTFGRLGLKTGILTSVGDDASARDVFDALKREKVSTALIQVHAGAQTAFSAILLSGSGERTVLVFRGASEKFSTEKIDWSKLKAKWFYVSSLGGDLALMEKILEHAGKAKIRVAWNPGGKELKNGLARLEPLIRRCDVFNLNLEEAMQLVGTGDRDVKALIAKLAPLVRRTVIVTDGRNGAYASDGDKIWHSGIVDVPRVNVTGAGDAFGSGVIAGLFKKDDLPFALAVGSCNSTGVVQQMGAKRGILRQYPSPQEIEQVPMNLW